MRPRRPRAATAPTLELRLLAASWQALSLLLDYPDARLVAAAPTLRRALADAPAVVREPIGRFLDHLEREELGELERAYVETFDVTRRACLYLTYFSYGDTRRRGMALARLKLAFRRAGVELVDGELPDHLSVVLELGACHAPTTAWEILNEHRAGIEVLRLALAERGSPWADLAVALSATLPPLAGDDAEQVRRLVAEGPPSEEVGLDTTPYLIDPRLNPRPPGHGEPDLPAFSTIGADR